MSCRLTEHEVRGFPALTIENELLAVTVLPDKGADIYAFVSKKHGIDLLWKSPWNPRRDNAALPMADAGSEAAWLDQYEGGWQLIFPNGGDACTYEGARLGFHGEASARGWDGCIRDRHSGGVELEFTLATARGPFHLRRNLRIEAGAPILHIEEEIENRGEQDMSYMWGHHPAFGAPFLGPGARLTIPARRFLAHDVEISPHSRLAPGASGVWPVVNGIDLSIVPPWHERVTEFGYLCDLEAGWYAIQNPELGLGFGLAWPREVFPYVWFWQELRGSFGYPWYGRSYVAAIEPFTSMPGSGLAKAIEHGTAPLLHAGSRVRAKLAAVLLPPGEVLEITIGGRVAVA